jgi:hypothetical protein
MRSEFILWQASVFDTFVSLIPIIQRRKMHVKQKFDH